jgi:biotin transport system substrate-specific component
MAVSTKITLRDLSRIAIFAAIIAALTFPGAIPLGTGVPITLQTLGVMLAGVVLGGYRGALAVTLYVVLGLIGLPILSLIHI